MQFEYAYRRSTEVTDTGDRTAMSFSPDTRREPTFFRGELARPLAFREAMSALHAVVVSDLRWKPKDKTAYKEWLAAQGDPIDWRSIDVRRAHLSDEIDRLAAELEALRKQRGERWREFERAKRAYFEYLYAKDRDTWFVLDPVITVHPDQVFFECFSQDESSYARLACRNAAFHQIGERAHGTTNVDYSQALFDEFQKIRSYKTTALEIDPTGFAVDTSMEPTFKEVKIDLPESWLRGFLQVSAAMTIAGQVVELHPMDVHDLCAVLRRRRELIGPRSMRFALTPGKPVTVRFDPWGIEVRCARSIYTGSAETEIRVWGRRRLHVLERLVPLARGFRLHLLGSGMPSFWVADLGDMTFTLGLSGWTANDWADAASFDLLAPREDVDEVTRRRVLAGLRETCVELPDALARRLGLDRAQVESALVGWVQAGRAVYDLDGQTYRLRELSREPLPVDQLRYASPREERAVELFHATPLLRPGQRQGLGLVGRESEDGAIEVTGAVDDKGKRRTIRLELDADRRMTSASCDCNFFQQNQLRKGPCEHLLFARLTLQRELVPIARTPVAAEPATATATAATPAPATEVAAPEAPAEPRAPGFFRRMWNRITGRTGTADAATAPAVVAARVDDAIATAIAAALSELSTTVVDVDPDHTGDLTDEIAAAVRAARSRRSRPKAAVAALRGSRHVRAIHGDDQVLLAIFAQHLDAVPGDTGDND